MDWKKSGVDPSVVYPCCGRYDPKIIYDKYGPKSYEFIEGAWDGSCISKIRYTPDTICTREFIELARKLRLTNLRFCPVNAKNREIDYLGRKWPPEGWEDWGPRSAPRLPFVSASGQSIESVPPTEGRISRARLDEHHVESVVAEFELATEPATRPATKLGGAPVGLPEGKWPNCAGCGKPMIFCGQIDLKFPLELSARFDFAYLFACPNERCICGVRLAVEDEDDERIRRKFGDDVLGGHGDDTEDDTEDEMEEDTEELDSNILNHALVLVNNPDNRSTPDPAGREPLEEYRPVFRHRAEPKVDTLDRSLPDSCFLDEALNEDIRVDTPMKLGGVPPFARRWAETPKCHRCKGETRFIGRIDAEIRPGWFLPLLRMAPLFLFLCEKECSEEGSWAIQEMFNPEYEDYDEDEEGMEDDEEE
jgi:hypothetical protein